MKVLLIPLLLGGVMMASVAHATQEITVYKSPTCSCCKKWVSYLEQQGYQVKAQNMQDMRFIKSMSGVKPQYASCHTAVIDGYVVEGHVPAEDIARLLRERPQVIGISAPGMPVGSPGMEQGGRRDNYNVVTLEKDGQARLFAQHGPGHD
jgi:hypothetical protein